MLRLDDLEQIIDRHDNLLVNGNPARMAAGDREAHTKLLEDAKREYAAIPKAMAVAEGTPGDVEIFLRGNHLTRGRLVPRRFPDDSLPGASSRRCRQCTERPAGAGALADRAGPSAHCRG